MKNLVPTKTLKKWSKYCMQNYPLAMKHFAIHLNQNEEEKVLMYAFDRLDDQECQRLIKKFFLYQKITDLKESDFTPEGMKQRLENVFPVAQEKYSGMEVGVQTLNLPVQEKRRLASESQNSTGRIFFLKSEIEETYLKEGSLYVRRKTA